jgi:hypothetical protein
LPALQRGALASSYQVRSSPNSANIRAPRTRERSPTPITAVGEMARFDLHAPQIRDQVADAVLAHPDASLPAIARLPGSTHETVRPARADIHCDVLRACTLSRLLKPQILRPRPVGDLSSHRRRRRTIVEWFENSPTNFGPGPLNLVRITNTQVGASLVNQLEDRNRIGQGSHRALEQPHA